MSTDTKIAMIHVCVFRHTYGRQQQQCLNNEFNQQSMYILYDLRHSNIYITRLELTLGTASSLSLRCLSIVQTCFFVFVRASLSHSVCIVYILYVQFMATHALQDIHTRHDTHIGYRVPHSNIIAMITSWLMGRVAMTIFNSGFALPMLPYVLCFFYLLVFVIVLFAMVIKLPLSSSL